MSHISLKNRKFRKVDELHFFSKFMTNIRFLKKYDFWKENVFKKKLIFEEKNSISIFAKKLRFLKNTWIFEKNFDF